MIEFDVRLCRSGEVVVFHDETVERMTDGHGPIADLTLEELKSLHIREGQTIPTLREALDSIDRKARVIIELKTVEVVEPTAAVIRDYIETHGWSHDQLLVTSFNHYFLARFRELCPGVGLAAILA